MRVILVSPWRETDPRTVRGAPDQAFLVDAMRKRGWEVKLVRPSAMGSGLLRIALLWPEVTFNLIAIPAKSLGLGADLVICMDGKALPGAWLAALLRGAKLAKFQHGIKDFRARRNRLVANWINADVILNYLGPGLLFAVEDGSGAHDLAARLRKVVKLYPAHSGVCDSSDRNATFAFVGRLHRIKGAGRFLEMARLVKKELPDARCLVIGAGPLSDEFTRSGLCEMTGEIPHRDVAGRLQGARVLCATSPYGNFTLPVVEAMALGVVPVVFGVAATARLLRQAGVSVRPGDVRAMAREVVRLLSDDGHFREASARALERAAELPSWDARMGLTLDALEGLCSDS